MRSPHRLPSALAPRKFCKRQGRSRPPLAGAAATDAALATFASPTVGGGSIGTFAATSSVPAAAEQDDTLLLLPLLADTKPLDSVETSFAWFDGEIGDSSVDEFLLELALGELE